MKVILSGLILIFLGGTYTLNAQYFKPKNEELLNDIAFITSIKEIENHKQWNILLRKLEKKYEAESEYFLDYLFYKTHQKLLKKYVKGTTFINLMESGKYDCVTATITYSILLKYFDIKHQIIETDYHVFIIAELNDKEIVFESTDPRNGFISNEHIIEKFKKEFLPTFDSAQTPTIKTIGTLAYGQGNSKTIYKKISLKQLSALQYFNQGLIAMHNKDFNLASRRFQQYLILYDSDGINMLSRFVVR